MGLDSFSEALQSEILFGNQNLSLWIGQVQAGGGLETLFELESWLKGLNSFLDVRHLPLSERERAQLISRNFAPEIQIVRRAIQICENRASEIVMVGAGKESVIEVFIQSQQRKEIFARHPEISGMAELSPAESIAKLLESFNDLRVLIEIHGEGARPNLQVYLSLQRSYRRILKDCRYLSMLVGQKFRLEYDLIENPRLSGVLRSIPEKALRRKVAMVLLHFYRCLKYLKLVSRDLSRDRSLRHLLVIFSLLHEEMDKIADYMKSSFLKVGDSSCGLSNASELIVCSLAMEARHLSGRELIFISRDPDASSVFGKIESSHGLLRNCFENCIVTLVQALDASINAGMLFPQRADGFLTANRLRQDLWELRQYLKQILEKQDVSDSSKIIERLGLLRDTSMNDLMHPDHVEFERFADALISSSNPLEVRNHMRKFVSYLEALTQEVSKRSVLQEASSLEALGVGSV